MQVGVFSEKRNADRLVELLKKMAEAIVISEAAFHRVQLVLSPSANTLVPVAEGEGYEAIIVR